jgi:DNA ligase-1
VSPVSTAARGLVSSSRGLSLRFPRFIKTRDDKNIEQASTPGLLADIYNRQQGKEQIGVDEDDLIDVDVHSVEDESSDEEEDG